MRLTVLPGTLAVCRLAPDAEIPLIAFRAAFFSVTRTAEELSLVLPEADAPTYAAIERGWRALKVLGPLDFALAGILASLAVPLADAGIPIFALSTFDTDYLLVKSARLRDTVLALAAAGHIIESEGIALP